jgi:hypothetical protein
VLPMTLIAAQALLAAAEVMPKLEGEFLTGKKAVLPDDTRGRVTLVTLGFTYDSRWAVEAWIKRWRAEFGSDARTNFYEVPMIDGMARMGKWFIDSGMRKGTPKQDQSNVITVYGGTKPWKDRVGFDAKYEDDAYLILIDAQGVIRWTHRGQTDAAQFDELARAAKALLRSDRTAP